MYIKRFDEWNQVKKQVDARCRVLYPKPREIRNISLGINVGSESDGKRGFYRPVIVLQKLGSLFLCCPLTSKGKIGSKYYYLLKSISFVDSHGEDIHSSLMLSHIRVFDKNRFFKRKGRISLIEYTHIKKIIQQMIAVGL